MVGLTWYLQILVTVTEFTLCGLQINSLYNTIKVLILFKVTTDLTQIVINYKLYHFNRG